MAGVVGTHVIVGEAGTPREAPDALPPVASEVQLVHREQPPTPSGTPVPAGRQGHLVVDGKGPPPRGDALRGARAPPPPPELRLYSDASRSEWGAHLLDQSASGLWSDQETSLHINILEMKALFLALQTFQDTITNQRVTAMCDNSTVVDYLSKQGGTVSDSLCELTGQLLRWTEAHNVLLEARYLPGQSNVLADLLSRHNQVLVAEWSLLPRPIRNTPQCEASPVLLPDSRPSGRLRRRLLPPVEQSRRVRVPTLPSGREVGGQSQRDPKSLHDSDRPPLAGEVLVRRPPPPADPTPSDTTSVGLSPTPTPLPSVPRRRPRPEPSRVETVKHLLRKLGFSRRASLQLS